MIKHACAYETGPWPKRLCAISPRTYRVLNSPSNIHTLTNTHTRVYYTFIYQTTGRFCNAAAAILSLQMWTLCRRLASIPIQYYIPSYTTYHVQYIIRLGALTDRHDVHGHSEIASWARRGERWGWHLVWCWRGALPCSVNKRILPISVRFVQFTIYLIVNTYIL